MKFQKTEKRFCRWKSTDNKDINIFLSLENPSTFSLAKEKTWKRTFNTNSQLSQNRTEKRIMSSKRKINWLFNDKWCYLFIACFDWKIQVFQQTVVRVYNILNTNSNQGVEPNIKILHLCENYQVFCSHCLQFLVTYINDFSKFIYYSVAYLGPYFYKRKFTLDVWSVL